MKSIRLLTLSRYKVKRQIDKKVKIIKFNMGGEFYGRYDELGQNHNFFVIFIEK